MSSIRNKLTEKERIFCELFVNGCAPYAGNIAKCYEDTFQIQDNKLSKQDAVELMAKPEVKEYLKELELLSAEEAKDMKRFLTANLKNIVEEASHFTITHRKSGETLSPAAMRSVAVNAAKALMEMYPVREAQVSKVDINSSDKAGITFNVIVPGANAQE